MGIPRVYRLDIWMISFYETIGIPYLHVFSTCTIPIIHLFYPQKIGIGIVLDFASNDYAKLFFGGGWGGVKEVYFGICARREFQNCTQCRRQWIIQRLGYYCRISELFSLFFYSRPSYRYSQLSQDDEDLEGSETFKYNPRPKGLRSYRDYDTSDDVRSILTYLVSRILSLRAIDNRRVGTLETRFLLRNHFKTVLNS